MARHSYDSLREGYDQPRLAAQQKCAAGHCNGVAKHGPARHGLAIQGVAEDGRCGEGQRNGEAPPCGAPHRTAKAKQSRDWHSEGIKMTWFPKPLEE